MKKLVSFLKRNQVRLSVFVSCLMSMLFVSPVSFAAEDGTKVINKLTTWATGIVAAIGLFYLLWGIFKFAQAHKNSQQGNEHEGVNTITAGAIMFFAGGILTILQAAS